MGVRINQSWREQAKAVWAVYERSKDLTLLVPYKSVWEAASYMSKTFNCKHETAKKEIRRAIKTGGTRYGAKWTWKDENKTTDRVGA